MTPSSGCSGSVGSSTSARRSVTAPKGAPAFWISAWDGPEPNREVHVAFRAADAEHVRAFHEAALSLGAESLHEPRLWPEYHPGYYGAFVRDPDGNNVEAVCHTAPEG